MMKPPGTPKGLRVLMCEPEISHAICASFFQLDLLFKRILGRKKSIAFVVGWLVGYIDGFICVGQLALQRT